MPGPISLNSIINLMNAAAADTERSNKGDLGFLNVQEEPLETIRQPNQGKKSYEEAVAAPAIKISDNQMPVDPYDQVMKIQSLDSDQQAYLMQAFKLTSSRMS
jgi:hypothetical protein